MHLSDYMSAHDLDDEAVAVQIGRSRVTVSRIRRRLVRPDWVTLGYLFEWSNGEVTPNDFQDLKSHNGAAA